MPADRVFQEALERFQALLRRAEQLDLDEPAAMTLATADRRGRPAARVVLLRGCDERGFAFYTNSHSRKGEELAQNPWAALCFYWEGLREQVRIEGHVERVSDQECDAYWARRPRESQLGAWASLQSQPLDEREALQRRLEEFSQQFSQRDVPRPPHWVGYRVVPERIEFWRGLPARLHERTLYERVGVTWRRQWLYP